MDMPFDGKPPSETIVISLPKLAGAIDHCLLQPNLSDDDVRDGLLLARDYNVAAVCVNPSSMPFTWKIIWGISNVRVCGVASSASPRPNDNARDAMFMLSGMAREIDMVVDSDKVLSGEWDYIEDEVKTVKKLCDAKRAALKVIFKDNKLQDEQIVRLCEICTREKVAFIGIDYSLTEHSDDTHSHKSVSISRLTLIRRHVGAEVKIKVVSNVKTLDELLYTISLDVTRVGTSSTTNIIEEAKTRGIGQAEVEVDVKIPNNFEE